jgi:hypothetical protein
MGCLPRMNEGMSLGQFGSFDIENYGDLLYPVLFQKMFEQRRGTGEISKFSLRGSKSLQDSGYASRPVRALFSSRKEMPHTLMIGGGDLLRTDWIVVASHYRSITERDGEDMSTPFLRRLMRKLSKQPPGPDNEFRQRYMRYPAAGPFIIKPGGRSKIKSVAYCSCGVPFGFDEAEKEEIAGTFDNAGFIYVRDYPSRNALLKAGVTREIHVAPDLIVALSDFFDAKVEREKGRKILQKHGVNGSRRILIFQSNPQPPEKTMQVLSGLKACQARFGCEVALLPIGFCHGDKEYLRQLAADSSGAFKYVEVNSIFDIMAVLAAGDVFLGTSLHGNITAFSFGIPHVFGPIPVVKREGFLEVVDLPMDLKLESWAEAGEKLDLAISRGPEFFETRAAAAKKKVHEVFDGLFRVVKTECSSVSRSNVR